MATVGDIVVNLATNTQKFTKGLSASLGSLGSFVGRATAIAAPLTGLLGIGASVGAARDELKQERLLAATLASTGGAARLSSTEIVTYAEELQSLTGIADDVTVAAAGVLATFTKVNGQVFKDGIRLAQDMSARFGQDLHQSIIQIGKALQDPILGLVALRRVGVSFSDSQKTLIKSLVASGQHLEAQKVILSELQTEFGGAAAAAADPWELAKAQIGEAAETLGFVMLPALNVINEGFRLMFGAIASNKDEAKALGGEIAAFAKNFGGVLELAILKNQLLFGQMFAEVAHFFGVAIPAYLGWFSKGWENAFLTLFDIASTVFINIGENVREIFAELWDFIISGGTDAIEFDWTPLLQGAERAVEQLPNIPERAIGEWEKQLGAQIDGLTNNVGESIAGEMKRQAAQLNIAPGVFTPGQLSTDDEITKSGKKKKSPKLRTEALQRGSIEAYKAIIAATSGAKDELTALKVIAKATTSTEQILRQQKRVNWIDNQQVDAGGIS